MATEEARWFMYAADELGTVAEMPLVADDRGHAESLAREWLATYDHGFSRAIVVNVLVANFLQSWSTPRVWAFIMSEPDPIL